MSRRRSSGNLDAKVYVGDLARDVSERDLEKVFKQFGTLRSVWVARNPPGFAFIEFDDERDAADAIKELDGRDVCGARVRVRAGNDYPSRSSRPSRRSPETTRKPFDPQDRCYRCNNRGHYAYDCEKYNRGGGSGGGRDSRRSRSNSRSVSRERRRSYSRSRSNDRYRRRSRS